LLGLNSQALPIPSFSYSGRLMDANDNPVAFHSIGMQVKVRKGVCVFYQESTSLDLSSTSGYFTLDIGTGFSALGSLNLLYSSGTIQDINSQSCVIGPDDIAYINIIASGLITGQSLDFGWVQLKNSYQGLNALKFQGKSPSEFISASPVVNQPSLEALLGSGIIDSNGALTVYSKSAVDTQVSGISSSLANYALKDLSNVSSISSSKITGLIPVALLPDLSGTYTLKSSLSVVATSGLYSDLTGVPTKVSDFINDAGYVSSLSFPNVDWSKITNHPTTLSGYGITDSARNLGGIYGILSGLEVARPTSATAGTIFLASDTSKIYYSNGSTWSTIGGSVAPASTITVSAPLTKTGTAADPIINIPVADISNSGYLSSADWNVFNAKASNSLIQGKINIGNASGIAAAQSFSGDVAVNEFGVSLVNKIQNFAVSGNTPGTGHVFKYDGARWTPNFIGINDIRSGISSAQFFPTTCGIGQTLSYSSLTDSMSCVNIAITSSQISFPSTPANAVLIGPDGTSGGASFRGLISSDLPSIPWTKLSSTPTTLSGYGITNGMENLGGSPSVKSGADASKPSSGLVEGAIYFATDTKKIYQVISGSWAIMATSTGTVSSLIGDVTSSGSGAISTTVVSVGGATAASIATGTALSNAATAANTSLTIVKRDSSGGFTAGSITSSVLNTGSIAATGIIASAGITASGPVSSTTITTGSVSSSGAIVGNGVTSTASISAAGAITGKVFTAAIGSSSSNNIDLGLGNTHTTTYNCASTITLTNLNDGASYNVVVQDTTSTAQCSFSATGVSSWRFVPANAARTSSSHTVYSILRAGSTAYVWWTSGF
jgi:hypothetical protein